MSTESLGNKKKIKDLEKDLFNLETHIRDIWEFLPLPIAYLNPLGVILDADKSLIEFLGYPEEEIVGQTLKHFISPPEKMEKITKETIKKGVVGNQEAEILTKNKEKVPISINTLARKDEKGDIIGYFVALQDITESKKFQERLRKEVEEARYQAIRERDRTLSIINNFTDGLAVLDKEGKILLFNPQAEKFFGIKKEEVEGKGLNQFRKAFSFSKAIEIIFKEGKIKKVVRKEFSPTKVVTLEITTIPMVRERERKYLVIFHDITREKTVERLKTEFVSLSAHQLHTPLSAIKWSLDTLLKGDVGELTDDQKKMLKKTYKTSQRIITLVNELLDVAKIEEGKFLYALSWKNLEDLITPVIDFYKREIKEKRIEFKFQKPRKKLPKIKVDAEKVKLAIQNLVDNSLRYTPSQGKVVISLRRTNKEIEFSIKDTGMGIPQDQQKRVFAKFFRGKNAIRVETEGTGLGLFIAKNIIEAHKGKIWFKSEKNKGTTFYFTLPI